MSFYTILGVEPTASADQIKASYRRAAMRWHPDRNPGNVAEAEARFKELAQAYTVLSDPAKRSAYDDSLREPARAGPDPAQARSTQEEAAAVFFRAMVEMALSLAQQGYSRDVLLGALLSQGCPAALASTIADQVHAKYQDAARQAAKPEPQARTKPEAVPPGQTKASGQDPMPASGAKKKKPMPLGAKVFFASLLGMSVWSMLPEQLSAPAPTVSAPQQKAPEKAATPSHTVEDVLAEQIPSFDGKSGRITYASLPQDRVFDGHRDYLGKPYEIKLIQGIKVQGKVVAFFASKPIATGEDDFSCHACNPILSAMLVQQLPETGVHLVLALQPLTVAGGWGQIDLQGDRMPSVLQVGPDRSGFIIKDGYAGQGYVETYASVFGIEAAAFRKLGDFHLETDSAGSGECDGKPESQCPSKSTTLRFVKTSVHGGYYDLMVKERTVEVSDSVASRAESSYTMRYDGAKYAPLKARPKASAAAP